MWTRITEPHPRTGLRILAAIIVVGLSPVPRLFAEDPVFSLAEDLFQSRNYYDAVTEYKRFLYFNRESDQSWYALYKIGQAYRYLNEWDRALPSLKAAEALAPDEESRVSAVLEMAVTMMAQKNFSGAELQLLRLSAFGESAETRTVAALYQGLLYILTYRWKEAEESLRLYFDGPAGRVDANRESHVFALLTEGEKLKLKSPRAARVLSFFIPGAGQFYAEDPLDAFNALIINGLSFALFGFTLATANYPEAVLTFLYLISRYYPGNVFQAGRIAEDYNADLQEDLAAGLLKELQGFR